jgi:protein-disulfide isomerase
MKASFALMLMAAPIGAASGRVVEGNPQAKVRVIVHEDLQCSDCAVFRRMLDDKLLPKYGSVIAVEHRDFPLAKHAWARPAAIAARFFDQQDSKLGVKFRQTMMAAQESTTAANFETKLSAFAKTARIDPAKALAALKDEELMKLVEADFADGIARGVARTPTVFVDGDPFIETFTVEEISKSIDQAVARSKQ